MKTHDLELCEGQQGRLVFTITAPPGTDTTLRGAVFADPKELVPLPMVAEGDNALVIPATQAGYHHYEVRAGGATILYGVLRTLPSPLVPPGAAGWDIDVDMTQELPHVDVGLLQGPQGPQGEPGASAYEAAVAAGYEGTEEEFNEAMAALPQDAAAAAQSAADAAASQVAAAGSAQAAASSAEAASGSAAAAADSASTAGTQAGVATAQATAAAESAETATTQATAAGQSATAAAGSATDAGNSATAAAGSASDAAASASDAATDAATATAQATEATTQAGNAAASATTASQQATAAGNSASAAAGSATTASTKATEAAGSASTAATNAAAAEQSAQDAADSAADAAESAELLGNAALQGRNNTFTQTNTFNGAVALNGVVTSTGSLAINGAVYIKDADLLRVADYICVDTLRLSAFRSEDPFVEYKNNLNIIYKGRDFSTGGENWSSIKAERINFIAPNAAISNSGFWASLERCEQSIDICVYAPSIVNASDLCRRACNKGDLFIYTPNATDISRITYWSPKTKRLFIFAPKAVNAYNLHRWEYDAGNVVTDAVLHTSYVTDIRAAFRTSTYLTNLSWTIYDANGQKTNSKFSESVEKADEAFFNNYVLPSSMIPSNWPVLSTAVDTFRGCRLIDETKANSILDSLPDWSTEETPTNHIITFAGTAAATTWLADGADLSHVQAAEAKGWTVDYGQNA